MQRSMLRVDVRRRNTTPAPVRKGAQRKEMRETLACLGAQTPRIGARIILHADARCLCGTGVCTVTRDGLRCKCGAERILPDVTAWTYHPLYEVPHRTPA